MSELLSASRLESCVTVYDAELSIFDRKIEPATVNWSAIGSQSPEVTRQFAYALLAAADEAEANTAKFIAELQ